MPTNINKSPNSLIMQIENLDIAVVNYFNDINPIFIYDKDNNAKQIACKLNVGETWEQVADIEKRQSRGDFILQKPIITIRPTSIEPIKEWNRNSAMKILIDKQLYKNPTTKEVSAIPKNRDFSYGQLSVPVYEYTYMKYPTHFMRGYKLNIWSDYIEDQNRILETVITGLISSNTIIIENDNYKTFGYVRSIQDDSNYDNRDEETRMIKNYIELEFEGYLTNLKNIIKVRNASHFKITETLLKNN